MVPGFLLSCLVYPVSGRLIEAKGPGILRP